MSNGKDALQIVPLHLPHPILGGPPCPSRREARPCERHRKTSAVPAGIQHASVLGAVKDKPPLAVAAPSLTTPVRGSTGFVRGWDEGMTTAEQRNGRGALLLQGEHSCGQLSRAWHLGAE